LKNEWTPALTIRTALISLQALLCAPEPGNQNSFANKLIDDPQDAEVARMYKTDKKMFEYTAKLWTENYAKESTVEDKIRKLMEMGFEEETCKDAL
jgi:ubiquitin-conjugating enzyme (huntingtin interacting protein 2)